MVAVHRQWLAVESFWGVLSYTCSVFSREILAANWAKHNVINMAATNSLSLCLESSCGFLHSLSSSPGKFKDVCMAIPLPSSNPAHMVLFLWSGSTISFKISTTPPSCWYCYPLILLYHFWNELSHVNDVLMNRNKVVRKTMRWSPGYHRNHSGPWIIFHGLHCLHSEGVGTAIWEGLPSHRNSIPVLHSFIFFSLVISGYFF